MKLGESFASSLAFLWAGLVIGGSLIAAPAKFNAPTLTLPTALEVGREQFFWIGIGEGLLCTVLIGVLIVTRSRTWALWAPPIAVLMAQRLMIMPILDLRTVSIIAGQAVPPSNLHVLFIVLEVVKVVMLIAVAAWQLRKARVCEAKPLRYSHLGWRSMPRRRSLARPVCLRRSPPSTTPSLASGVSSWCWRARSIL